MKNRVLYLVLTALLVLLVLPGMTTVSYAQNHSGSCGAEGSSVTWSLNGETGVLTIFGTGEMRDWKLCGPWQKYENEDFRITEVILESGITSIGAHAFAYCESLTRIAFPDTLTEIGEEAFYLTGLTELELPGSVKKLGDRAFESSRLITITIPKSVKTMGKEVFAHCSALKEVRIQNAVIGESAFWDCSGLTEITIPPCVKKIGANAFKSCENLTRVVMTDCSADVGMSAFKSCEKLKQVDFGPAKRIEAYAFQGCKALKQAILPETLQSIGRDAFSLCWQLTDLKLPAALESIGDGAFYNCTRITSLVVPKNVTQLGNNAFALCRRLTEADVRCQTLGRGMFSGCTILQTVKLAKTTERIAPDAFANCKGITDLSFLPKSVTTLGEGAFAGSGIQIAVIPDTVTKIGFDLFDGCKALTEAVIPKSITVIPGGAFQSCPKLKRVTLPDSLTTIGVEAFFHCTGLHSIKLPDGVNSLGNSAFEGSGLRIIKLPKALKTGNERIFAECPELTAVTIPSGLITVGWEMFLDCPNLKTVDVPDSVINIMAYGLGYVKQGGEYRKLSGFTLLCGYDSIAEDYAKTKGFRWITKLKTPCVTASNVESSGKVKLTWEPVSGAKYYIVYRASSKTGTYSLMKTTENRSYVNTTAKPGRKYYYKVCAVSDDYVSPCSSVRSRTCDLPRPVVSITRTAAGKPKLTWKKVDGAVSYKVYRCETKTGTYKLMKTVTDGLSYTNTSAEKGKTYYYKVRAVHSNIDANSACSLVKSITAK